MSDSPLDIATGRIIRLPCKFIQGNSDFPSTQITTISQQLKKTGKNILPVIVKNTAEDKYTALFNTQILEAAKRAKLDFVWCMVVDDEMLNQISLESGQPTPQETPKSSIQINILQASEAEIVEVFKHLQTNKPGFEKIKPNQIAKAIVDYRKSKKPKNLSFISTLKCGIGKAKITTLSEFLSI